MSSEDSQAQRVTWGLFALTLALCAALLHDSINWNFGYDQGTFAYGGSAILKGARPYFDFWDIKPPNIFYTYALGITLFGESVRGIRIFDYWNALLTIALIWLVSVRLWRFENIWWVRLAAMFASFAYVLCYFIQGYQDTAQCETYSLPLLLISVLLVLTPNSKGSTDTWRLLISGALIGITCFFKYPFGLFILMPVAIVWVRSTDTKSRLKMFAAVAVGLGAALGAQALLLLPSGELQELWRITRQATLAYNQNNFSGTFGPLTNLRTALQMFNWLWVALGLVGCILLFWKSDRTRRKCSAINFGLPILCVLIGLIIVQAQNKGYKYHYQLMLPWAVMLIGAGFAELAMQLKVRNRFLRYVAFTLVGLLLLIGTLWSGWNTLGTPLARSFGGLIGEDISPTPNQYIAGNDLADYVNHNSAPTDHIFIFGFQPYVYWITERKPANRFLNTIHFKPTNVAPELRQELVRSFQTPILPKLLFVEMGDHYTSQGNSNDDSWTMLNKRYPEILRTIQTCYEPADTLSGDILAFRLKPIVGGIQQ